MTQDFSKKMSIVIREDVASWQLTNSVGHIAAYLGNKMKESFDTGGHFISKDEVSLPRNSQFPIVTLRANAQELSVLAQALLKENMLQIIYVQEMIDEIDDEKLSEILRQKTFHEMNVLGIGIFGNVEELKKLTSGLKLWK